MAGAKELLAAVREGVAPMYAIESEPAPVTIAGRTFHSIPALVIVDARGRVKHAHLLSAFPEQGEAVLAALRKWTFKPYRAGGKAVEVETRIVFGMPPESVRAAR